MLSKTEKQEIKTLKSECLIKKQPRTDADPVKLARLKALIEKEKEPVEPRRNELPTSNIELPTPKVESPAGDEVLKESTTHSTGSGQAEKISHKKTEPIYAFPTKSRCQRCGTTDTEATSTQGKWQYRRCLRAICRHTYSVEGTKI